MILDSFTSNPCIECTEYIKKTWDNGGLQPEFLLWSLGGCINWVFSALSVYQVQVAARRRHYNWNKKNIYKISHLYTNRFKSISFIKVFQCTTYIERTPLHYVSEKEDKHTSRGAQWLNGRVFDSRPRGRGVEPHRRHCVVVLEQYTFILA